MNKRLKSLSKVFGLAAAGFGGMSLAFSTAANATAAGGLALGPVTFAAPWVLVGLAALPVLWWMMRTIPPTPVLKAFPAIRLLFNLKAEDQQPQRMPWWQRAMRLAAAGAIVLGLAHPGLTPAETMEGNGPVTLVVDNGWASARNWPERAEKMNILIDRAESSGRQIVILPTAAPADGGPVHASGLLTAAEARRTVQEMTPQPWPENRKAALEAFDEAHISNPSALVWLSSGLDDDAAPALAGRLSSAGRLTVMKDEPLGAARLLVPPTETSGESLSVTVRRPVGTKTDSLTLTASDDKGRALAQTEAVFNEGETEVTATFDIPAEVRNQLVRVSIEGENSAGATLLLDERWRRRPVGLVAAGSLESAQPLLNESHYIRQALDPYADLKAGSVDELVKRKVAVMILTDSAALDPAAHKKVDAWVQEGGTLLRFAGPHLAAQIQEQSGGREQDSLLPVALRGDRIMGGGALSASHVGRLAPFEAGSPFYSIKFDEKVTVQREVMAQPGPELDDKTWARLDDGTPLVTAKRSGNGWVVLVHTTANADWSNLSLSGAFVEMMRAVVANSQGVSAAAANDAGLPPLKTLDGGGHLIAPPPAVRPLNAEAIVRGRVDPNNPPGFYGNDAARQAHNLYVAVPQLKPLSALPEGAAVKTYAEAYKEKSYAGPLLAGALSLALLDMIVLLAQQGHLRAGRRKAQGAGPAPAPQA
jgi:hypothetical protein